MRNLYEWHEGQLTLVDVLPGGAVADGGAAGWRGPGAAEETVELPDHSHGQVSYFAENAVSEDGSRVYFTDLSSERLYLRESAPGGTGETLEVSPGRRRGRPRLPMARRPSTPKTACSTASTCKEGVAGEARAAGRAPR